ncbi:MAG: flagellar biosynthetic protein FliO [Treponema sp.]|nr:flagellar biosynthetic protein FliO [Treponema sp.]
MKRKALVLCAVLALGMGVVAGAQSTTVPRTDAAGAVGTAQTVDETTLVIGDKAATVPAGQASAGPNTFAYFIRMIVVLALVLGAIYLVYRLMRRMAHPQEAEDSAVKILASTGLGPGKKLHVVGLGEKAYLIGVTEASVSLIAEVQDKEFVDALTLKAALSPEKAARRADFSDLLGSLLGRARPRSSAARREAGGGRGDYVARQRERLRKF